MLPQDTEYASHTDVQFVGDRLASFARSHHFENQFGLCPSEGRPARPVTSATEKLARLTIDLPPELHGRFKAACAKNRTKMKDEVLHLIEGWTQKHENL